MFMASMPQYNFQEIEGSYSKKVNEKYQKELGQFFTPPHIANFMIQWLFERKQSELNILDPAAGLGIFERIIHKKFQKKIRFDLWEIDGQISSQLNEILNTEGIDYDLRQEDFLLSGWDKKYDGIISNPPYFKHHYISNKEKIATTFKQKTGFEFSIQTNVYCWFLIKCLNQLKSEGRLAFIIPSEFLNANYGEAIKEYLMICDVNIHLISIDYTINVFNSALTTSLILLAEKDESHNNSISFYNAKNDENINLAFLNTGPKKVRDKTKLDPLIKWKNYFKSDKTYNYKNLVPISTFGNFSRGIATGANSFFTISNKEIKKYRLPNECIIPCISKANQVSDPVFTEDDYESLEANSARVHLFNASAKPNDDGVKEYLQKGLGEDLHKRYLTRNRDPWYSLEKREVSKIWVTVFNRNGIKLVWNKTSCLTLTCFHNFFPTMMGKQYEKLIFLYLYTDLAKEMLEKEKREYGNGLNKFEPNDISKTKIVDVTMINSDHKDRLLELHQELTHSRDLKNAKIKTEADQIFRSYLT